MSRPYDLSKVDLKPKRHHGYSVLIFIFGTLFPPLAVAIRFGLGSDFWLNLFLTICGYIPGHVHNFYIQNVRNNKNNNRTPKWAQRYGLVDTSEIKRKQKRSQWANRYNDRLPNSTLEGQPYEEGQEHDPSVHSSIDEAGNRRNAAGELWNPEEERYYGRNDAASTNSGGRWHYPANFDDAVVTPSDGHGHKKKKGKKDRWARTEDAYSLSEEQGKKKKKKKRSVKRTSDVDGDTYSRRSGSTNEFPEDPEGGLYGNSSPTAGANGSASAPRQTNGDEVFNHEF